MRGDGVSGRLVCGGPGGYYNRYGISPSSSSGRVHGHRGLLLTSYPSIFVPSPCLRHQEDPKELSAIWKVRRDDIIAHERLFAPPSPVCLCRENRADGILARRTLTRFHPTRMNLSMVSLLEGRLDIRQPSRPPLAAMKPSAPSNAALATPALLLSRSTKKKVILDSAGTT